MTQQQHQSIEIGWFILDDSSTISAHLPIFNTHPFIHYHWQADKLALGEKRNRLHQMALDWGLKLSAVWMMITGIDRAMYKIW